MGSARSTRAPRPKGGKAGELSGGRRNGSGDYAVAIGQGGEDAQGRAGPRLPTVRRSPRFKCGLPRVLVLVLG